MTNRNHIVYTIPKSNSFEVALKKRKPRPAFDLVVEWLSKHTMYKFDSTIEFVCWLSVDAIASMKVRDLLGKLDLSKTSGEARLPDGQISARCWRNTYPFDRLFEIVAITESFQDVLRYDPTCNYSVSACAHSLFLTPTKTIITGQDFDTNLGLSSAFTIHLNRSSSIWPDFCLPFDNVNDFLGFYTSIKSDAPFKLNDKYWKLVIFDMGTGKERIRRLFQPSGSLNGSRGAT